MSNDIPKNLFLNSQKMAGHVRTQNDRIFTNIGFLGARHLKQDAPRYQFTNWWYLTYSRMKTFWDVLNCQSDKNPLFAIV